MKLPIFLAALMTFAFSAIAQDNTQSAAKPVMNVEQTQAEAQVKVREFYAALQRNDKAALDKYILSKEGYIAMTNAYYSAAKEDKRAAALDRIQKGYEEQVAKTRKSFDEAREAIAKANIDIQKLAVADTKADMNERNATIGGKAGLLLRDDKNQEIKLYVRGFYNFNGQWYVLDGVRLRQKPAAATEDVDKNPTK